MRAPRRERSPRTASPAFGSPCATRAQCASSPERYLKQKRRKEGGERKFRSADEFPIELCGWLGIAVTPGQDGDGNSLFDVIERPL